MEFAHEILNDVRFGIVLKGFVSFFVVLKWKKEQEHNYSPTRMWHCLFVMGLVLRNPNERKINFNRLLFGFLIC